MNPDRMLGVLRELSAQVTSEDTGDEESVDCEENQSRDLLIDFARCFAVLDRWMCAGGPAPRAWQSGQTRAQPPNLGGR